MTPNGNRLPTGGRIDRDTPLRCTVDDVELTGYRGDTVASALIAAGWSTVAPSLYLRRPRGIVTADNAEPNALVQVDGRGVETATTVELTEGLAVRLLSGVGALEPAPVDPGHTKKYTHTDVLVVGGGPAGVAAALAASSGGARVLLVDEAPELGGSLCAATETVALGWVHDAVAQLAERPEVTVLRRSTAFGYYDANYLLIAQRFAETAAQRLWHVRAREVVLATGAHERPVVFAGNDRPGVMLAAAARRYVNQYAAVPGHTAVVFTTNDSAYAAAVDLAAAGVTVAAIADTRPHPPADLAALAAARGIAVVPNAVVEGTAATGGALSAVHLRAGGQTWTVDADLLAVSGGWNPAVHLFSQSRGTVAWDPAAAAFLPDRPAQRTHTAGAVTGAVDTADCLEQGIEAGLNAAEQTGYLMPAPALPELPRRTATPANPVWLVPGERGEQFVDLQRDVTVADVARATGAGLRSVEHVKRYTTIGTGADQGRTSGVVATGVIATLLGAPDPGAVGTTTFRAPYTPVPFAVFAGRDRGRLHDPVRTTPIHSAHVAEGAVFEDVGQWKRPRYYPLPGEDMAAAIHRECDTARIGVAMQDASTLGKIDVVGRDAGEFLNRVYTNGFQKLKVGNARYGMMCTADGMVFDDGVVFRLAADHYYLTTTTGNAAAVLDWLEEWLQTEWPDLDVHCTSVTEQWCTVAVVGPGSRDLVADLAPRLDCSNAAFGFMTVRETVLGNGIPARIARVSFSGELAFEVNVASWHGLATWRAIRDRGATPYGTETMHVLRAEKGFPIIGQDTDGTVTPVDLGMDWIVSTNKDFIGRRSLSRPDTVRQDRKQLVGLLPADPDCCVPEGSQIVAEDAPASVPVPMIGHVTSSYHSAALRRTFALALVKGGRARIGEKVLVAVEDGFVPAMVTESVFYDKEGLRRDG